MNDLAKLVGKVVFVYPVKGGLTALKGIQMILNKAGEVFYGVTKRRVEAFTEGDVEEVRHNVIKLRKED